jgi:hypothetical protein
MVIRASVRHGERDGGADQLRLVVLLRLRGYKHVGTDGTVNVVAVYAILR